ncbi:MAG: NfeD family protein [Lachnospiraceae bacterium]|nr:NfeD family protein [Lachnospiraceae bacterium]
MVYFGPVSTLTVFWIIAIIIFIVVEILTTALTTLWFIGGAVVALIASALGMSIPVQLVLFVLVSGVLLFTVRPYALKHFNPKRSPTNVDAVIGKQGLVTARIDNGHQTGKVEVDGMEWSARSAVHQQIIEEGQMVNVESVDGVKLIVKPESV